MRVSHVWSLALLVAMAAATTSHASIVTNGGFEDPAITSSYQTYNTGSTAITGWVVGGTSVDVIKNPPYATTEGNQAIDLAGTPGPGSISQDLATAIGQTYEITFSAAANGSGPFDLRVYWDAVLLLPIINATSPYSSYSYTVIATDTTTTLTFATPQGGNAGPFLDDVAVNAVPEPATLAIWSLGLGVAGLVRLRRKK